jgi:hypothetical protein
MNKALKSVVLIGILLTLVLTSACTLRASKPPALQPTATSELLFLSTATTVAGAVATQTAAVQPAVATATTAPEQPAARVAQPTLRPGAARRLHNRSLRPSRR